MFQRRVIEKIKTHILTSEKYDTLRQPTDDIMRRMRIACWISKAIDTHCEYVIIIAFPLQQWLSERAFFCQDYTYIACLLQTSFFLRGMTHSNISDPCVSVTKFNPFNPELNPIYYLLALLGAHHFLHVSRIRVKLLTFRRLMSYIYGAPILDVSRSHTTTQHSR